MTVIDDLEVLWERLDHLEHRLDMLETPREPMDDKDILLAKIREKVLAMSTWFNPDNLREGCKEILKMYEDLT